MELRKTGIILLALLLAAMAMVPMASAGTITAVASGVNQGSWISYKGIGFDSVTDNNWHVWAEVYDPNGAFMCSADNSCSSSTSCNTGWSNCYPYPSVHGYYTIKAYATADGHGVASNSVNVYW